MKRNFIILITSAILLLTGEMSGQRPQGQRPMMKPEESAKNQTEWITKELNLNTETSEKVYQIELKLFKVMSEQRQKMQGTDRDAAFAVIEKARDARDTEMKTLLGDEKFEKLLKLEEERRQQRDQDGPRQGPPRG